MALLVLVSTGFSTAASAADEPHAVVNTARLNLRQGAAASYAVIDVLERGDEPAVTGRNAAGSWYHVSLSDGRAGWVSASLVKLTGDLNDVPVVAAPAAAASAAVSTKAKTSSPQDSVIVFQVSSGGPIYAMNPDGSNLRYLTTGMDPALSPDGKTVAFTRWQGETNAALGSLWVIKVDGTGERQVMGFANQAKSPTWSPDGKQIVISFQHGGRVDKTWMCVVDRKRVEVEEEIEGVPCMPLPADPLWALRLVDVATGAYEDLGGDKHSFAPTWNPTNDWQVVFRGDKGLEGMNVNDKSTWVLKEIASYRGPVFSPDGTKIATTFNQNDHWEVHVMNADGTGEVRLTETPMTVLINQQLQGGVSKSWDNAAPAWSPDGRQIAFISDRNGAYEIWVMNADGSNPHVLLPASALGGQAIQYQGMDERVISWR
jgi:Tol biopolymer transport system component